MSSDQQTDNRTDPSPEATARPSPATRPVAQQDRRRRTGRDDGGRARLPTERGRHDRRRRPGQHHRRGGRCAIYTASLKHTQDKVQDGLHRPDRPDGDGVTTTIDEVAESETPRRRCSALRPQPTCRSGTSPSPLGRREAAARAPVNWKSIVVGALAAFALAAVALTGIELVTGHALSGGDGTTITQVSEPSSAMPRPPSRARRPRRRARLREPTPSATASASTPDAVGHRRPSRPRSRAPPSRPRRRPRRRPARRPHVRSRERRATHSVDAAAGELTVIPLWRRSHRRD